MITRKQGVGVGWRVYVPFFGIEEISAVGDKHLFNSGFEHDRAHGTLLARTIEPPVGPRTANLNNLLTRQCERKNTEEIRRLRVRDKDMNTMFGVFFVFSFSFKNELLQHIIIPSDNAIGEKRNVEFSIGVKRSRQDRRQGQPGLT